MEKIKLTIKVTVFKASGKYYSEEHIAVELDVNEVVDSQTGFINLYMPNVVKQVKSQLANRYRGMYLYINHVEGYPCLITPQRCTSKAHRIYAK